MENTQKKTLLMVLIVLLAAVLIYRITKQNSRIHSVQKTAVNQTKSNIPLSVQNGIYNIVEVMPQYPGGEQALMEFLSDNVKYPPLGKKNGIQGKVIVRFVVSESGKVKDATVLRSLDPSFDKEALRVVNLLEDWIPGEIKGKKVAVRFTLPIVFKL